MISILVSSQVTPLSVDAERCRAAIRRVLEDSGIEEGEISLALVDDATIQELNRRYLDHDWPTDVLSFVLDREATRLEGEIVVGAGVAERSAAQYGWAAADELLLCVVHGALHLVDHDDSTPKLREAMRARERHYLAEFGLRPAYDDRPGGTQ